MDKLETVQSFEAIGLRPEIFTIANPDYEGHLYTYYTFAGKYLPQVIDVWEIIGLRVQRYNPLLLDMRMMHIDNEMFDVLEDFTALHDAPCSMSLDPNRLSALITFLEGFIRDSLVSAEHLFNHFQRMATRELQGIHFPAWRLPYLNGTIYRYFPHEGVADDKMIYIFNLPSWSSQYGTNQVTIFGYDVFSQEELAEPNFEPLPPFLGKTRGVRPVTFNRSTLSEFIRLLKQHTYESFIGKVH